LKTSQLVRFQRGSPVMSHAKVVKASATATAMTAIRSTANT
jgi:hypothetical protein